MTTPLEKAAQAPDSMKARILAVARKLFGDYGFHGVTTRMIAGNVGIDVSTLHYHWGDKKDLYEAVITALNEEIRRKLVEIEQMVHGQSMAIRLEVAIDALCQYFFDHPETSQLILLSYFSKTRHEDIPNRGMDRYVSDIAIAMGLAPGRGEVSPRANARVLAAWNSIVSFASGESLFRGMLHVDRTTYIDLVKETLKFLLIPAFTTDR